LIPELIPGDYRDNIPDTLLRYATSFHFLGTTNAKLRTDFSIFKSKHTWLMTYLYIMTFGSFIGYSSVFPKLIQELFEAGGIDAANYAWLGAFLGSIFRPVGGWLSDKYVTNTWR
jgi:MFS transporter, NNP family, nitrate/nitrite transporter